jgi:hypothetical protein
LLNFSVVSPAINPYKNQVNRKVEKKLHPITKHNKAQYMATRSKTVRKMISSPDKTWKDYKKALVKKAEAQGVASLSPSADLCQYMKNESDKYL